MKDVVLYIKCLRWNVVFLLGCISVGGGFLSKYLIVYIFTGAILLIYCQFGRLTVEFYKKTLADLKAGKDASIPYKGECFSKRQGRKWAVHEYKHRKNKGLFIIP